MATAKPLHLPCRPALVAALVILSACGQAAAAGPDFSSCLGPRPVPAGRVEAGADFDLVLPDGSPARLAGLAWPGAGSPAAAAAAEALARAVASARLVSGPAAGPADRWGRVPVVLAAGAVPLAALLVEDGHAAVRPGDLSPACTRLLLRLEDAARRAGRGLWADGGGVADADDATGLSALDGRFTIASGRIRGVGQGRSSVYLNFGGIRGHDFSVTISKRSLQRFEASGMTLTSLAGRRVRIRGVVAGSGVPRMEIARPEEIERLD